MPDKENVPEEETESQRRERWMRMEEEKEQKREQKKQKAEEIQRRQEEYKKLKEEEFYETLKTWGIYVIIILALVGLFHILDSFGH